MTDYPDFKKLFGVGGHARDFMLKAPGGDEWVNPFMDKLVAYISELEEKAASPVAEAKIEYLVLDDPLSDMINKMTAHPDFSSITAYQIVGTWQICVHYGPPDHLRRRPRFELNDDSVPDALAKLYMLTVGKEGE